MSIHISLVRSAWRPGVGTHSEASSEASAVGSRVRPAVHGPHVSRRIQERRLASAPDPSSTALLARSLRSGLPLRAGGILVHVVLSSLVILDRLVSSETSQQATKSLLLTFGKHRTPVLYSGLFNGIFINSSERCHFLIHRSTNGM